MLELKNLRIILDVETDVPEDILKLISEEIFTSDYVKFNLLQKRAGKFSGLFSSAWKFKTEGHDEWRLIRCNKKL